MMSCSAPGFYSELFLQSVFAQHKALSQLSRPPADLNISASSEFSMMQVRITGESCTLLLFLCSCHICYRRPITREFPQA
ncbi:uncharacterized protein BDW70DRAFT_143840 [Aspergillus foveolatus]|uniref:uncharacterized protein n=1 Tax=Aspergillus foveolatus TaxID=210207 RepID=UPI003CCD2925